MDKKFALKLATALAPIVVALAAYFTIDVIPIAYDVCQAVLPNGSVTRMGYTVPIPEAQPDKVDGGAVR